MSSLKCPKCGEALAALTYANIEVDRCSNCGGIWFDRGEIDNLETVPGSEAIDTGNPEIGKQMNRVDKEVACPRCQVPMQPVLDIDEYSIWYEKCPNCSGVWLDAGEFRQYKGNFRRRSPWEKLRQFLRSLPSR